MSSELSIDRWVRLMDIKHTSRDPVEKDAAQRERLDMEIRATWLAYEKRPKPPTPGA